MEFIHLFFFVVVLPSMDRNMQREMPQRWEMHPERYV